jgi:hypothetical protein
VTSAGVSRAACQRSGAGARRRGPAQCRSVTGVTAPSLTPSLAITLIFIDLSYSVTLVTLFSQTLQKSQKKMSIGIGIGMVPSLRHLFIITLFISKSYSVILSVTFSHSSFQLFRGEGAK